MTRIITYIALLGAFLCVRTFAQETVSTTVSKDTGVAVSVLGSVNHQGIVYMSSDGTLVSAIAASGGWVKTANLKKIVVLHEKAGEKPEKTEFDLTLILEAQAPNPKLSDGDIVYVRDRVF